MSPPVLILGAGGQVGSALVAACTAQDRPHVGFTSREADVTSKSVLFDLAAQYPHSAVINAAAYTAVDKAEADAERAYAINATAPAWLAAAFGGRPIIHYSTDYVFSGDGSAPYTEDQATSPLGVYGLSKRVGESAVLQAPGGMVVRTAWVYGKTGNNFLKTMMRVGAERGHLRVVADQRGTPTHADTIAAASLRLLDAQMNGDAAAGIYHLTAKGDGTWYDFATEIFSELSKQAGIDVTVDAITSDEYPTPAKRPAFSVLSCDKIDAVPGITRPDWKEPIAETVAAVLATSKE